MTGSGAIQVVVCAGGLGTRIAGWSRYAPKEFYPVAGRPGIAHLLDEIARSGSADVVLVCHPYYGAFTAWARTALSLGVVSGIGSFADPAFNVVVNNHVYRVTPDRLLGRVRSAARLVAWGTVPLGTLVGGFLASAFGAQPTLIILTGIMCGVAAAATLARGMRSTAPVRSTGEDAAGNGRPQRRWPPG